MKEETKKSLQKLCEATDISRDQVKRDFDIVYFLTEDTEIRERKTIAQLHNYYVSLHIENDMSDDGIAKRLNVAKNKCKKMTKELSDL